MTLLFFVKVFDFSFHFFCFGQIQSMEADLPENIVQLQLNAYNAQNLDELCSFFDNNVLVYNLPDTSNPIIEGQDDLRKFYDSLFKKFPSNHADITQRVVLGDFVVDHELIARDPSATRFSVRLFLMIRDLKICVSQKVTKKRLLESTECHLQARKSRIFTSFAKKRGFVYYFCCFMGFVGTHTALNTILDNHLLG